MRRRPPGPKGDRIAVVSTEHAIRRELTRLEKCIGRRVTDLVLTPDGRVLVAVEAGVQPEA